MKRASFLSLAVLGALALLPLHAEDETTPLAEQMDGISSALKSLRKTEGWEAKAEVVRKAQEACLASLEHLPSTFEEIKDPKEKAKATADYKRLMTDAHSALCQLEIAFLDEDQDAVDEAMDLIKKIKKEGHQKYEDDE